MVSFEALWEKVLSQAVAQQASDVHIHEGKPVFLRVQGHLQPLCRPVFSGEELWKLLGLLAGAEQSARVRQREAIDFSWQYQKWRFRVNAFRQQQGLAMVLRLIPAEIPSMESLGCPRVLYSFLTASAGLLLVTGRIGSGKSTTMASFLAEIHRQRPVHAITLEDPVEYLYPAGRGIISQRELGTDFQSFPAALRSALREDPDILLVGELRDEETLRAALDASDTGHLVLASLHSRNAAEAVMRMESLVPAGQQEQLREQLSLVLGGIFSQQLLPAKDGGRVCAVEVLLAVPAVRNLIRTGRLQQLPTAMLAGQQQGMQTMEMAVRELLTKGRISREAAAPFLREQAGAAQR